MNFMKKWQNTYKHNLNNIIYDKPYHSAGHINTSSAGTMIGLIGAHKGYNAIIGLILITAFVSVVALNNGTASATASTLSLSVSDDTISMDIAATRANGTFMKSTNTTITASTTNATGYELRVAASNAANPSALIHTTDTNAKLNSISSATTESQFKALAGTTYNGKWGYLPSKYNSSTNTDFLPAPSTTGDIINKTECANGTSTCPAEDNYTLAIGARVDSSIKLGTYNNTFVILATANAIPYTVVFDDNVVSNMPTDISSTSVSTTVPLPSNTPVRSGYTFLGWCDTTPTNTNGTDTCSGTTYAAGSNYTIDQTGTNNLHLYAMWGKSLGNCTTKATCMQFMDRYTLSTLLPTVGSSTTLYDMRDGQSYTVALLADGKYWMVENLNLAGGTTLHSYDTDMPEGYTLPTANNFQANNTLPASTTAGFNNNTKAFVYNTGNDTDTCTSSGCYSYYSWIAATLGSGLSLSTENTDAPYSICPKGWRLPTSGKHLDNGWKRGDFYQLAQNYGVNLSSNYYENSATFYNNAGPGTTPNFLLAGYYSDLFDNGGLYGYYWSATSYSDASLARHLLFSSGDVSSANDYGRGRGFSVRCLFGS